MTGPSPGEHAGLVYVDLAARADALDGTDALVMLAAVQMDVAHLIDQHTARCRRAKVTWAAIGTALGLTRQGAQQRYGN